MEEDFHLIFEKMRETFNDPKENWICELHSDYIHQNYMNSESLPISQESSKKLYEKWDRGEETTLYKKIEKELV